MLLDFESCPRQFRQQLADHWQHWCGCAGDESVSRVEALLQDESRQLSVARSFLGSDFFLRQCSQNPGLLPELLQSADLGLEAPDIGLFDSEEALDRRCANSEIASPQRSFSVISPVSGRFPKSAGD